MRSVHAIWRWLSEAGAQGDGRPTEGPCGAVDGAAAQHTRWQSLVVEMSETTTTNIELLFWQFLQLQQDIDDTNDRRDGALRVGHLQQD